MVLTLYNRVQHTHDADDVAAVRALHAEALRDPNVVGWKWWRIQEVHGERLTTPCVCGFHYHPEHVPFQRECLCGLVHLRHRCNHCGRETFDPPHGTGCGDLPVDHDAAWVKEHRWSGAW